MAPANKKAPVTGKNIQPPAHVIAEMRDVGKRLIFNIEQIEKRFCGPNHISTGIVMDPTTGEESYDPDLCNAKNEEEHLQAVKNLHVMLKEGPVLSTPELDPEETNPQKIKEWKKVNKEFEKYCKDQSALVPVKNGNRPEKHISRRSHPYAKVPPLALPAIDGASSSKSSPWNGALKVNRLYGSPFNNSDRHSFPAPFMPPQKFHSNDGSMAAHIGGTSIKAALTFPSANTRSSVCADLLTSGKQLSNMNDDTESIRSGFLDETRNEIALLKTGPRFGKQPHMTKASLALPGPATNNAGSLNNWIAESMKHTAMKDLDS